MHTCLHMHVQPHMQIHLKMSIHMYIHTHVRTCIHAYMHTCIHAYMHTYIHTSIRTVHTCIHSSPFLPTLTVQFRFHMGPLWSAGCQASAFALAPFPASSCSSTPSFPAGAGMTARSTRMRRPNRAGEKWKPSRGSHTATRVVGYLGCRIIICPPPPAPDRLNTHLSVVFT